ncbi:MAG: PH domain-containing protein, partial [Marmoricola sp.]
LVLQLTDAWDLPLWVWIVYGVVALADVILMPVYRYRVHRWETTDTAVYTQTGWIARERRIAPMSRVQTVDLEQSVVGRVLGLATVTVTTASAAGPLRIEGLDLATAERLVDDLTRRAEDEAGDAT